MPVTAALFERWKKAKGFASDRQACLALGVSNGNPGHWREGKNAHAAVIERMARDLGHQDREIAVLLFESMAEAANADAESRKTYERLAKKVRTLALTAVAVLASSSFPTPSKAREHGHAEAKAVFIMRTLLAWLKRLQQHLHIGLGIPAIPTTGVSLDGTSTLLRIARTH
jgi:hypothetical protein